MSDEKIPEQSTQQQIDNAFDRQTAEFELALKRMNDAFDRFQAEMRAALTGGER